MSSERTPAGSAPAATGPLPAHVAVIMDGNGRWAQKRLLSRVRGHEKGSESVRRVVRTCRELGIPLLTLYAFSTENWQRPKAEVNALMRLLKRFLAEQLEELQEKNIRLNVIGRVQRLPQSVQKAIEKARSATRGNTALQLNLALSYGGRDEITRAVRDIAGQVREGTLGLDAISEETVAAHLDTCGLPDPDLLIRTGGDMRISNFMLWQLAYTEIFVTDTLWPDFSREEFLQILGDFQGRARRFGRV